MPFFNRKLLTLRPDYETYEAITYNFHPILLSLTSSLGLSAQIKGVITDSLTNEPLMYVTVQYEGTGVGAVSNADGEYQVETRNGWNELTFPPLVM